eukprot:1132161-Rhodomonas_salina.1
MVSASGCARVSCEAGLGQCLAQRVSKTCCLVGCSAWTTNWSWVLKGRHWRCPSSNSHAWLDSHTHSPTALAISHSDSALLSSD